VGHVAKSHGDPIVILLLILMSELSNTLGLLAGIIALFAYMPYVQGTLSGKTKPNRASWIIWSVVGIIIAASYWSAGASSTIWIPIINAFCITFVALLSIKFGEGGWTTFDKTCLAASGISLIFWFLSGSPLVALGINILIDAIGSLPTIKKTYHRPEGENKAAWAIFFFAYTVNLFAIEKWNFEIAGYPVYLFILVAIVMALFMRPRHRP
jgi:hypothetical protein